MAPVPQIEPHATVALGASTVVMLGAPGTVAVCATESKVLWSNAVLCMAVESADSGIVTVYVIVVANVGVLTSSSVVMLNAVPALLIAVLRELASAVASFIVWTRLSDVLTSLVLMT